MKSLTAASASWLIAALAVGCQTWRPERIAPAAALQNPPHLLRIDLKDGRAVVVADAQILGDTVVGMTKPSHQLFRAPLADVRAVASRHLDPNRTGKLVAGIGLAGVVVVAMLAPHRSIPVCQRP